MNGHKVFSNSLKPIPGYEGVYYIHPSGKVVNKHNRVLKTFNTKDGEAVELRNQGQRERVLIKELLKYLDQSNANKEGNKNDDIGAV